MIKVTRGKAIVKGNMSEILAEYSTATKGIINAFVKNGIDREAAVDMVKKANNIGTMTSEEIDKKVKEEVTRLLSSVVESLNGKEGEENE